MRSSTEIYQQIMSVAPRFKTKTVVRKRKPAVTNSATRKAIAQLDPEVLAELVEILGE